MAAVAMRVHGELRVPGDKSISHRALILGALSHGASTIRGILRSDDIRSTAAVLAALGVIVPDMEGEQVTITGTGPGGLVAPFVPLDAGNSGTTARLMSGVLAARPFTSRLVGDASLSRRPMGRVARPLGAMGATFAFEHGDGLPMTITGGALRGVSWTCEAASAQVKSAILLAGCTAGVPVEIREPLATRDHTERMMRARGLDVRSEGTMVTYLPGGRMDAVDTEVPGDPSAAAFLAALAALSSGGELVLSGVCANPARAGAFRILEHMGARIGWEEMTESGGEPAGTLVVSPRTLRGVTIEAADVPALIDELPVIACVAARAAGETRVTGAAELRVKESDRIALVVRNLRAIGVDAEELPDGFVVRGSDRPLAGRVATGGDHRIAMAFGVLAAASGDPRRGPGAGVIELDDPACVAVSYPAFWTDLANAAA